MNRPKSYAVILAGGNGERLWPLSTAARPKQFVSLFGGKPLIRHAADRLKGLFPPERIFVITARRFVAATRRALPQVPPSQVIGEPCRRDTAAAVAAACGLVRRSGGEEAVGCILTADQLMTPVAEFRQTIRDAIRAASAADAIVTVGIRPTFPATGYGYVEVGDRVDLATRSETCRVGRFVEKPDVMTAQAYLESGRFLWNSGMFFWRVRTLERAFATVAPELSPVVAAVASARSPVRALAALYPSLRSISFDYAVMEKIGNVLVVRGVFGWDDVGSWLSLRNHFPVSDAGNVSLGRTALLDVSDSVVVSEDGMLTAVVGLRDVVVVRTQRATLVCSKDRAQDLKALVRRLSERDR